VGSDRKVSDEVKQHRREALDTLKFDNGGAVWESALRGDFNLSRKNALSGASFHPISGFHRGTHRC